MSIRSCSLHKRVYKNNRGGGFVWLYGNERGKSVTLLDHHLLSIDDVDALVWSGKVLSAYVVDGVGCCVDCDGDDGGGIGKTECYVLHLGKVFGIWPFYPATVGVDGVGFGYGGESFFVGSAEDEAAEGGVRLDMAFCQGAA